MVHGQCGAHSWGGLTLGLTHGLWSLTVAVGSGAVSHHLGRVGQDD